MALRNRRVLLAARPVGIPKDTDYAYDEIDAPDADALAACAA